MSKELIICLGDEYTNHLCNVDSELCKLIEVIGNYKLSLQENYYDALVKRIIGQQLSLKAANTIISRVVNNSLLLTPQIINEKSDIELRQCGLSYQKIAYIRELTNSVLSGNIDLEKLSLENDSKVIESLIQIKGIGIWTAEMFLIFSLGRENILSNSDVSIRNAILWLYNIEGKDIDWEHYWKTWSPYNTIVSLYLWEIVNRNYIKNFKDINELYKSTKAK
ncbi:hypothetical protein B5V89_14015 [Heyndrickxia sporothermodurans]|uniref:DNA-3-methyladenine glycosylase family protein n=1 Tax=Heyndrickxia sporothermodurans TaxID=46224 RepID=UPI000D3A6497|nr:DNA-3-methyladenine glycosylase [Heyndrickxia sporothermodurans]PTY77560.1 hypothetical protein B5V89_14015 [Heyndrickxia sporothermodurans]